VTEFIIKEEILVLDLTHFNCGYGDVCMDARSVRWVKHLLTVLLVAI